MRVLAHIHTLNDADVIEQMIEALQRQTRQPDAILLIDNGSTDATLDRTFPECVTVIRNGENLGTSGAIRMGFTHALQHQFDWVWIFDADSIPEPDALAKLLGFYEELPRPEQEKICFLACRVVTETGETKHRPMIFTDSGGEIALPEGDTGYSRCDCILWSGSLYRMSAVGKIGLPGENYVLDWAELEYGYRARQLGFRNYMIHDCVLHHDTGGTPGLASHTRRIGPLSLQFYELSPIRCYYQARNSIYFWLYQCKDRKLRRAMRNVVRALAFTLTFAVRPVSQRQQLLACMRGIWDGLTMHMERRY